jgi:spermidine synthase
MDGAMPETLWQGFASGIGHPVIGLDHLAFLLAAGVLAATLPRGDAFRAMAGFLIVSMAGVALHLAGIGLGATEALVAASVLMVGLALLVFGYVGMQAVQSWHRVSTWGPALLALALVQWSPPLRFVDQPAGAQLVSYRDGVMAAVSVVQDDQGIARLRVNNRAQEGSSASGWLERRLAVLPLHLREQGLDRDANTATKIRGADPKLRALFLGLGTGFTAAAAAEAGLAVDAVELLPEVVEVADYFARFPGAPQALNPVRHITADARRYVQTGESQYDLIVADLFHPARDGAGSLYTVEHFSSVRSRLAPSGLFCQWLALHQMELNTLRSIVAAFVQVYPEGYAVLLSNSLDTPVLGLVARPDVPRLYAGAIPAVGQERGRRLARLDDEFAVLGSALAGPAELKRFVQGQQLSLPAFKFGKVRLATDITHVKRYIVAKI